MSDPISLTKVGVEPEEIAALVRSAFGAAAAIVSIRRAAGGMYNAGYHLELSGSALAIGALAFWRFIPFTIFGLVAGVVADRFESRRLVMTTQAAGFSAALIEYRDPDFRLRKRSWGPGSSSARVSIEARSGT